MAKRGAPYTPKGRDRVPSVMPIDMAKRIYNDVEDALCGCRKYAEELRARIATLEAENAALVALCDQVGRGSECEPAFPCARCLARRIVTNEKTRSIIHALQSAAAALTHPNPAKPEAELVADLDAAREDSEAVFGRGESQ